MKELSLPVLAISSRAGLTFCVTAEPAQYRSNGIGRLVTHEVEALRRKSDRRDVPERAWCFQHHHANTNSWRSAFPFEIDLHLSELLAYTKRFEPASGWWRSILAATGQPKRFT